LETALNYKSEVSVGLLDEKIKDGKSRAAVFLRPANWTGAKPNMGALPLVLKSPHGKICQNDISPH
jgi:hypothetical protein